MSDYRDYGNWAQRAVSKGQHAGGSEPQRHKHAPPVSQAPPPPPAGYAWAMHPQYGMIMVPLGPPAAAAPIPPPMQPQQPWGPPAGLVPPGGAGPQVETCTLVKPGNRDTYAEFLATIPDLAPPSGYDAMNGRPSPESMAELAKLSDLAQHQDAPRSFGTSHRPATTVTTLK